MSVVILVLAGVCNGPVDVWCSISEEGLLSPLTGLGEVLAQVSSLDEVRPLA